MANKRVTKRVASLRVRQSLGHCIECGTGIQLTDLWCDEHRKTGPYVLPDGTIYSRTHEEMERGHGDRIRDLITKGKI